MTFFIACKLVVLTKSHKSNVLPNNIGNGYVFATKNNSTLEALWQTKIVSDDWFNELKLSFAFMHRFLARQCPFYNLRLPQKAINMKMINLADRM